MPEITEVIYSWKSDGRIILCKLDGIDAMLITREWEGDDLPDIIDAASVGSKAGIAIDKLFPKTNMSPIAGFAGAILSTGVHLYTNREGYYEIGSKGVTTNILRGGIAYLKNGEIVWK